jgi:hypothetical protein
MIFVAEELRSIMLVCRKSIGTIDGKNEKFEGIIGLVCCGSISSSSTWLSCVLLFVFMRDRVPIYSGTLSIIPIVGKGFGEIENQ